MPKRQRKPPSWSDVKSTLDGFDRPGLLALIHAMYTADKRNQAFLHARFGLGERRVPQAPLLLSPTITSGAPLFLRSCAVFAASKKR